MAKLIIENLSLEQAKEFARWYEGQGEQNADIWFECNGLEAPLVDVHREGGCITVDKDTVTLYCKNESP